MSSFPLLRQGPRGVGADLSSSASRYPDPRRISWVRLNRFRPPGKSFLGDPFSDENLLGVWENTGDLPVEPHCSDRKGSGLS